MKPSTKVTFLLRAHFDVSFRCPLENMANQLKKNYNNINFEERITQMQDELLKINQEQRAVDALIAKRASRQRQLLLERDAVDVMDEEATVDSTECSLKAESSRISALLAGLEGLMQFSLHNVSQNGALQLKESVFTSSDISYAMHRSYRRLYS